MLYVHTSMFPGQLNDPEPDSNEHIRTCCTEILDAIRSTLSRERFDIRFLTFPVFMAGVSTQISDEKDMALKFMVDIEKHCYGGGTASVRTLLQTIYEKQRAATIEMGDADLVDWVNEMELSGQHLILYGL